MLPNTGQAGTLLQLCT